MIEGGRGGRGGGHWWGGAVGSWGRVLGNVVVMVMMVVVGVALTPELVLWCGRGGVMAGRWAWLSVSV